MENEMNGENVRDVTKNSGQVKFEDCDESPLLKVPQNPHNPCTTPTQDDLQSVPINSVKKSKLEDVAVFIPTEN